MRAGVVVFPGSNCDRDMAVALKNAGAEVSMIWHKDTEIPTGLDVIAIPGGFSFGDYLRVGAIAARSPICQSVIRFADKGGYVFGVCNGFQVLTETGLLPGALLRNAGLKYVCRHQTLKVTTTNSVYTGAYSTGQTITVPIAHHDGNYNLPADDVKKLFDQDRVAFTYVDNPNGSVADIAGVLSENRRVLGMMPHPERLAEEAHGGTDGKPFFANLFDQFVSA
jgi:phosphoribosylformylglycinamidine synthase I